METAFQDMDSLSHYHWLFSDGLPAEDENLPPFIPRVLDFEQPSEQPDELAFLATSPHLGRTEPQVEASNPTFRSQPYTDQHSEDYSNAPSPVAPSKRTYPSPSQSISVMVKSCGLKRLRDHCHEDFPNKRMHPRSTVFGSTCPCETEHFAPSPIYVPRSTSQGAHFYKPNHDSSYSSWHHSHGSHSSREAPSFEERIIDDPSELSESKRCIKLLIQEITKVTDSNRYGQDSEITHQLIKRTEYRLKSLIETSPIVSQIVSAPDMIESYSFVTENLNVHNPPFCHYDDASRAALAMKCDLRSFPNSINPTSHCYATPLDHTYDCALLAQGEVVSGNFEAGDTPSNHPTLCHSICSNPATQSDLITNSSTNESPECRWLKTPPVLHQPAPHSYMPNLNEQHNHLVHDFPPAKHIVI